MAYVPKLLPEDQENQFSRTEATETPPVAGGSAGATGGAAPGIGTSTQFGSNAAKLTDYLKANESQVGQFGQEVAGKLGEQYNQARGAVDQGVNQFTSDVGNQYTPPDPTKVNQALQDPAAFVKDSQNMQQWQNWYNPSYSGPQNFEGSSVYSNLNNQVNKAVENASLTKSIPGLGTYLGTSMGISNATPGMTNLDAALLQRDPQSRQAIQAAAAPFQNLSGYLNDKSGAANQAIQAEKDEVRATGENTRNLTKTATDQFSSDLQNRVASAKQGATTRDSALRAAFEQGTSLTPEEMSSLGIDPATWAETLKYRGLIENTMTPFTDTRAQYGGKFDLLPYFSTGNPETAFNTANVANADDYAREQALQMLTQNQFNLLPDDPSQAGTAPKNLASFNANQAKQDVQNQLRGLDKSVIDQYSNFNLGAYDESGWRNLLSDPSKASQYQSLAEIFQRNEDLTSPQQQQIADTLLRYISETGSLPGGGDAFTPPTEGSDRVRTIDGKQMWWDGGNWVDMPGSRVTPGGGFEVFDPATGQYRPGTRDEVAVGAGGGSNPWGAR